MHNFGRVGRSSARRSAHSRAGDRRASTFAGILALTVTGACSSSGADAVGQRSGGDADPGNGADAGTSPGEAGRTFRGPSESSVVPDAAPDPRNAALVDVSQRPHVAADGGAAFDVGVLVRVDGLGPDLAPFGACTTSIVAGPCSVAKCTHGTPPPDRFPPNAGGITVTTPRPWTFEALPEHADGTYDEYSGAQVAAILTSGDAVRFSATGADIGPFSNAIVVAPSPVDVTQPTMGNGGENLLVARTADLPVRWTGGGPGYVLVHVETMVLPSQASTHILCRYPVESTQATIPAALMGQLDSVPMRGGTLTVQTRNESIVQDGAWSVTLRVSTSHAGCFIGTSN